MVKIWDIVVRVFHWSLAITVTVALVTGLFLLPTWITVHLIAGTTAAALVVIRIVWGIWGPGAARFAAFVHGPRKLFDHCRELADGRARRHLGHNPLGGAMIVALLVVIALLTLTGVIAEGGAVKSGPLAFATPYTVGWTARSIHNMIAYVLLALVVLHLAGVAFESRRSSENLLLSMIHGHKPTRPDDIPPPHHAARPVLAGVVATLLVLVSSVTVYALAQRPALGVPHAPLDPVYANECGACHIPYHPSLEPAASWSAIMANLSHHFGQNAELAPATAAHIRTYLLAHSAEHYDTLPAHRFRHVNPADPLRITATRFWKRIHRNIPDSAFSSKSVVSRGNCGACHTDARSGLFQPSAIAMPEEAEQ